MKTAQKTKPSEQLNLLVRKLSAQELNLIREFAETFSLDVQIHAADRLQPFDFSFGDTNGIVISLQHSF